MLGEGAYGQVCSAVRSDTTDKVRSRPFRIVVSHQLVTPPWRNVPHSLCLNTFTVQVAIKRIAGLGDFDNLHSIRMLREVKCLRHLRGHPNVVPSIFLG